MSARSLDEVVDLYRTWGTHRYDEEVTQLEHALQCAALATAAGASEALIAAALLHDVGHLLHLASIGDAEIETTADLHHERVGADHLAGLFPSAVTSPIALHVEAKRYRCTLDPGEADRLSEGSRRSLVRQGGAMDPAEVTAFEAESFHRDAVVLRVWDDAGKVTDGIDVAPLDAYVDLLERATR